MKILAAGASGLIGQELIHKMCNEHEFTALGRDKEVLNALFLETIPSLSWSELEQVDANSFDAVINLCGVNIATRWTSKIKEEIISSRVKTSQKLIHWIQSCNAKPHFFCANAVGIYGMQKDGDPTELTEDTPIDFDHPKDYLSEVGIKWQEGLQEARVARIPITITRFGVVLKKGKGFLGALYPSFISGLGSVIGNGRHYLSWIEIDDLVNAYRFLLNHLEITGSVNVTSPRPCAQKEFAHAFAHTLHRPLFLRTPKFIIRLFFGEMGECLINHGQKVIPKRLMEAGFEFKYPEINDALAHLYS